MMLETVIRLPDWLEHAIVSGACVNPNSAMLMMPLEIANVDDAASADADTNHQGEEKRIIAS